jgi:hypothetical protein
MSSARPPAQTIAGSVRFLQIGNLTLLISMVLYVYIVLVVLHPQPRDADPAIKIGTGACAAASIGLALLVRSRKVSPAIQKLQLNPDDVEAVARWRSGNLTSYVFVEAVVLYGFALQFIRGTFAQSIPYYVVGPAIMLLWWPRRP